MNPPADMERPGNITSTTLDDTTVRSAFGQAGAAFFADADILQRLNLIRHLLQSTHLVVLVVGESGIGKSAGLTQLQRMADERWSLCRISGAASAEPDKLLADLARCCDLPPDCGRLALRHLLAEHASVLCRNTRLPVVVVDDAHALTQPALAELAALASPAEGWHLLLAGEPLDEGRLQQAGFPAAGVHVLEWPHLSQAQTGAYLSHRLSAAGWSDTLPVTREQLAKLHRESHGLPAEIDRLAPEMLAGKKAPAPVTAQRSAGPRRRLPLRKTVRILGLVLLIGVAAVVLTQQDRINALFEQHPPASSVPATPSANPPAATTAPPRQVTPPAVARVPAATTLGAREPEAQSAKAGDDMPETAPKVQLGAEDRLPLAPPEQPPETVGPPPSPSAAASVPDNSSAQSTTPPSAAPPQPGASDAPEPAAEPVAPQSPPDSDAAERNASANPAAQTPQPAAGAASDSATARNPADEPEAVPETPPATLPAAEPDTATAPSPPSGAPKPSVDEAKTQAPAANVAADRQWLLSRPASHYTLQLLGSREAKPLQELIDRFALKSDTAAYKIQYQDAEWYVLVHGDFADLGAARDAMAKLPHGLRRAGPWPRPFSAVQQEVRRGRK